MTVPLLGSSAAQARQQQRQAAETPAVTEAVTAFIICVMPDGSYRPEYDLDAAVTTERLPTRHEVIAGCEVVASSAKLDMVTEAVTMNVVGNLGRMQSDPNYHAMIAQAREQAAAAMQAAGGS